MKAWMMSNTFVWVPEYNYLNRPKPTFFVGVPINSVLGFVIRTYKKVGFGRLRYTIVNTRAVFMFFRPL